MNKGKAGQSPAKEGGRRALLQASASAPSMRALVVFAEGRQPFWLKLLRPGFRHCFLALDSGGGWITLDPLSHYTDIGFYPLPASFDLARHFRAFGWVVVETQTCVPPARALPWRPFTCVEAVKRALGLRAPWVLTPWQLYRHLNLRKISCS